MAMRAIGPILGPVVVTPRVRFVTIDPRTPVIVGVGQFLHRAAGVDDALEPVGADGGGDRRRRPRRRSRRAAAAATRSASSARCRGSYGNPAWVIAERLGQRPRELAYTTAGGNTPQTLVNRTSLEILAGELDLAVLAGGEAWRTRMRARKTGAILDWAKAPDDAAAGDDRRRARHDPPGRGRARRVPAGADLPDVRDGDPGRRGARPDEHLAAVSELWARFSAVAADEPVRVDPRRRDRRGDPHDVAAEPARRLSLPQVHELQQRRRHGRRGDHVLGRGGRAASASPRTAGCSRTPAPTATSTPTSRTGDTFARHAGDPSSAARAALELAGVGIDDVAIVDLYSCFPSAVQLGAAVARPRLDRQLTRTGGLAFAGGPWNNYVMHAIATVVAELREQPGEHGLVWANGGYVDEARVRRLRHRAAGRRASATTTRRRRSTPCPAAGLASPEEAAGPATIEAYTVMHDRDGAPEQAIAACLLADGRRAWGLSERRRRDGARCCEGEWVGRAVTLDADGDLHV